MPPFAFPAWQSHCATFHPSATHTQLDLGRRQLVGMGWWEEPGLSASPTQLPNQPTNFNSEIRLKVLRAQRGAVPVVVTSDGAGSSLLCSDRQCQFEGGSQSDASHFSWLGCVGSSRIFMILHLRGLMSQLCVIRQHRFDVRYLARSRVISSSNLKIQNISNTSWDSSVKCQWEHDLIYLLHSLQPPLSVREI